MLPTAASGGLMDANERLIISAGSDNGPERTPASPRGTGAASGNGTPGRTRSVVLAVAGVTSLLLIAALCGVVGWATVANGIAHRSAGAIAGAFGNQIPLPMQRQAPSSGRLDEPFCLSLSDPGQSLCLEYLNSSGADRFRIANNWGRVEQDTYACAGITSFCLDADLIANKPGSSTCKPRKGCAEMRAFKLAEAANAADGPTYNSNGERQLTADEEFLENITPAPPAPKDPVSNWGWYTARPLPDQAGVRIPPTFLATSHEWDRIPDYVQNLDAFRGIFKEFGPTPIIRIGGASQDFLEKPPPNNIWEAMATMNKNFGATFLIGLPLWRVDAVDDAREMMKIAEKYLPKEAIVGYELGNEPEFWLNGGNGGWEEKTNKWVPGWDAYNNYFHRTALALNPCGSKPMLAGPGWGNVNTIDGKYLADLARKPGANCYMREMSVHYYPYVNNVTIDAKGLLNQDLLNFGVEKFKWLARIAQGSGFGLRISETNSLYGGGRSGLSDTMAGALWCADALFAFANAGASGFHFHWGFGGQPLIGGQPNTGVQTNFFNITDRVPSGEVGGPYPSVHAPWYSYLMFRYATAGPNNGHSDTRLTKIETYQNDCKANMKVWSLLADNGDMRVAILNKDEWNGCNVNIKLEGRFCGVSGQLNRLMPGIRGMRSRAGITWKGQTYDNTPSGYRYGDIKTETITSSSKGSGQCEMYVTMPAASAAVLEIKPASSSYKKESAGPLP